MKVILLYQELHSKRTRRLKPAVFEQQKDSLAGVLGFADGFAATCLTNIRIISQIMDLSSILSTVFNHFTVVCLLFTAKQPAHRQRLKIPITIREEKCEYQKQRVDGPIIRRGDGGGIRGDHGNAQRDPIKQGCAGERAAFV